MASGFFGWDAKQILLPYRGGCAGFCRKNGKICAVHYQQKLERYMAAFPDPVEAAVRCFQAGGVLVIVTSYSRDRWCPLSLHTRHQIHAAITLAKS
jgi:hypothetical protein